MYCESVLQKGYKRFELTKPVKRSQPQLTAMHSVVTAILRAYTNSQISFVYSVTSREHEKGESE